MKYFIQSQRNVPATIVSKSAFEAAKQLVLANVEGSNFESDTVGNSMVLRARWSKWD